MAAIDKTYTSSYDEYKALRDWAKDFTYTMNGYTIRMSDYIYDWDKESFTGNELPVMNTSYAADYVLIKFCPLKFVQDRMRKVYDNKYIQEILDGVSSFDIYERDSGSHVTVKRIDMMTYKDYVYKAYKSNGQRKKRQWFFVQVWNDPGLWYNDKLDRWFSLGEFGEGNTNTAIVSGSIRSVIRKIIKWKLPKGTELRAMGNYVGEELIITVK